MRNNPTMPIAIFLVLPSLFSLITACDVIRKAPKPKKAKITDDTINAFAHLLSVCCFLYFCFYTFCTFCFCIFCTLCFYKFCTFCFRYIHIIDARKLSPTFFLFVVLQWCQKIIKNI